MDDREVDEFFEGVAGHPSQAQPPRAAHRIGTAVRSAIQKQPEAASPNLSTAEIQKRNALLDSLEARGLFQNSGSATVTLLHRSPARTTVARWRRPLALAAAVALCAIGVSQFWPSTNVPLDAVRGGGDLTMHSGNPAAAARTLERDLTNAGAKVQVVQINDTTWSLSIDISRAADTGSNDEIRAKVRGVLATRGITAPDTDTLSILIDATGAR